MGARQSAIELERRQTTLEGKNTAHVRHSFIINSAQVGQRARTLVMNFTTLYLPNLAEEIQRRYNNREDFIFYWYEPDPLLSTIEAKRIDLPPWSETCAKKYRDDPLLSGVDCEIKPDTLLRGLHAATRRAEPDLAHFDESFVWAPGELDRIMVATLEERSRSSPRPTLEKMLTSRSFHTLQSSALDKLRRRKRGECKGDTDTSGKSDWCRETVFPELYFGGLVEALEEHMANGDLVFPEGK